MPRERSLHFEIRRTYKLKIANLVIKNMQSDKFHFKEKGNYQPNLTDRSHELNPIINETCSSDNVILGQVTES